jgi:hypothetical protein
MFKQLLNWFRVFNWTLIELNFLFSLAGRGNLNQKGLALAW